MTSEEAREWLRSIKDNYIHGGDEAFDNARSEALSMADEALRCKPCEDAVSRDLMTNTLGATCIAKRDEKGDLIALCSIDNLPPVTPQPKTGRWIPVSERLPEKNGAYLAYIINPSDAECRYIMTCEYFVGDCYGWCPDDETASNNVVAWMPLPEEYKAESEE